MDSLEASKRPLEGKSDQLNAHESTHRNVVDRSPSRAAGFGMDACLAIGRYRHNLCAGCIGHKASQEISLKIERIDTRLKDTRLVVATVPVDRGGRGRQLSISAQMYRETE